MRRVFQLPAWVAILILAPLRAQNIHIGSTQGAVTVSRGEADQAVARSLQATLVTDDRIATGDKSQAELQLDAANTLQLAPQTQVRLGEVYPGRYQIVLEKGALTWNSGDPNSAQMEVQSPSVSMRPHQPGVYSIAINADNETEIAAKGGILEVFAPTGSQWLAPGQKMLARGLPANPEFQLKGISRWRGLWSALSSLQLGGVASAFSSSDSGSKEKPRVPIDSFRKGERNPSALPDHPHPAPAHGASSGAPSHSAASSSGSHSSAASSSSSHSAPASSSSHGK